MVEDTQAPKTMSNVTKATTVGVVGGGSAAAVIAWLAQIAEAKYGVPMVVGATVLGTAAGFLSRWAAKLEPHE